MKLSFAVSFVIAAAAHLDQVDAYGCPRHWYHSSSVKSCTQLVAAVGESNYSKTSGAKCYLGRFDGVCFPGGNYDAAEAFCSSNGARLCTATEVKSGQLNGLRCGLDSAKIFTSTPCGEGKVWSVNGGGSNSPVCVDKETTELPVRCCGDVTPKQCSICPDNSVATGIKLNKLEEHSGLQQCSCVEGYIASYGSSGSDFTCEQDEADTDFNCAANEYGVRSARFCKGKLKDGGGLIDAYNFYRRGDVCAKTHKLPNTGYYCPIWKQKRTDHDLAKRTCLNAGARLCSAAEIDAGAIWNTGCDYDDELTWSSTPCGDNMYWAKDKKMTRCLPETARKAVTRCCADLETTKCAKCPPGSTSSAGSFGVSSCTCTSGWNARGGCNTQAPTVSPTPVPTPAPDCPANQYRGQSAVKCNDLQGYRLDKSEDKCGASRKNGRCPGSSKRSFTDAEAFCTSQGARLCTAEEVGKGLVHGTGCNLDTAEIWTNTPCCDDANASSCNNSPLSRMTFKGKNPFACAPESTGMANVRCCADQFPSAGRCADCPENSSSNTGSQDVRDCSCDSGFYGADGGHCFAPTPAPTKSPVFPALSCASGSYAHGSDKSCASLRWGYRKAFKNAAGNRVCGDTNIDGTCTRIAVTHADAKQICEDAGARLCTSQEEVAKAVKDTCRLGKKFWISKPCGNGKYWAAHASRLSKSACLSEGDTSLGYVACCADNEESSTGRPDFCANCPAHSDSSFSSFGLDSCTCDDGYSSAFSNANGEHCVEIPPTIAPTASPVIPTAAPTDRLDCNTMHGQRDTCLLFSYCRWNGSKNRCNN